MIFIYELILLQYKMIKIKKLKKRILNKIRAPQLFADPYVNMYPSDMIILYHIILYYYINIL